MPNLLDFFIAWKYLKSKNKGHFVSVNIYFSFIGITLGVAVLIIVMSVMNGFKKEIIEQVVGLRGHVLVFSRYGDIKEPYLLKKKIQKNKYVNKAFISLEKDTIVSFKNYNSGALIKGVEKGFFKFFTKNIKGIKPSEIRKFTKEQGVFIGKEMAYDLGIKKNDAITLITAVPSRLSFYGYKPKFVNFKVLGIFSMGMYEYDKTIIFMPINMAESFFDGGTKKYVSVFANDLKKVDSVKKYVSSINPFFYGMSYKDTNSSFLEAINVQSNVMFLILSLIILIAFFNVISSMVMLVHNKEADIAVLITLGLSRLHIVYIFGFVSLFISILGVLLGTVIGVLFTVNIRNIQTFLESFLNVNLFSKEVYFLSHIPYSIDYIQIYFIIIFAILIAILSSIYPCLKASKISPVEILKHE